ncbi:stage V sporulation protein AD [Clostridium sp. CX1]|uniref:Stage V sporulation protein AD n=1 Tax=Clostridium tanneri TaxID=3037988 RepID=A0ABU4JP63_9CLOT|nr:MULTISPECIES: stage V sporulation protein AD [unclassified Clostridium]MCT8977195.1 stage V sporulation protein AD [Clostridium sp. CX1]MDW8799939.1 stage V sporulation protein AD [Clostridium sp. A1-XYC3]
MNKKIGKHTVKIESKPRIIAATSIVGPKEGEGNLKSYFDTILQDDLNGKESFEKAESDMLYNAVVQSIKKAKIKEEQIDFLLAGDLLNQLTSSSFAARGMNIPFLGLYGACSTMTESLGVAAMLMDGNFANYVVAATSSHFAAAERQFRFPLEFGNQRPPTAQWTVTGAGSMVLGKEGNYPYITHVTIGKVKDYGINDPNNMGAAMAPAAVSTIYQHFNDTKRSPKYYDLIVTGDLGKYGKEITISLLKEYGYNIKDNYIDCGEEIFDSERQGTNAGGSGCGCSAVVYSGYIYKNMLSGKFKRVLLVSTGALLSTTSSLQGESIPGIAHAVSVEYGKMED